MDRKEKQQAIDNKQKWIDSLPYTPLVPYPYCCVCFEKLTADNILEKEDGLWDICIECKDI